jgi:hypothetical protein
MLTQFSKSLSGAILLALIAGLALIVGSTPAAGAEEEVYRAFAVNMGSFGPAGATTLDIHITRWSTEEERQNLYTALVEKGHEEFIKILRKEKETGWGRFQGRIQAANPFPSTRIRYAHQEVVDGQRQITLITDRPISMREAVNNSRSTEYDTTAILLQMPQESAGDEGGKDGKGKGTLYLALKPEWDKKQSKLKLEEWGNEPIRLTTVNRVK